MTVYANNVQRILADMGRIAIVNDSEDTLEVFKAILAAEEHEFRTFAGPAKFLGEFREGLFDLVLLDRNAISIRLDVISEA